MGKTTLGTPNIRSLFPYNLFLVLPVMWSLPFIIQNWKKNGFVLHAPSPDVSYKLWEDVITLWLRSAEIEYEELQTCSTSDSKWRDKLCNNLSCVIHNGRFLVLHRNPLMSPLPSHLHCYSALLPLIAMLKRNKRHWNERRENESDDEDEKKNNKEKNGINYYCRNIPMIVCNDTLRVTSHKKG